MARFTSLPGQTALGLWRMRFPALTMTTTRVFNSDTLASGDQFGRSVALDINTLVVGAPGDDSGSCRFVNNTRYGACDQGGAYIFTRSDSTWLLSKEITGTSELPLELESLLGPDTHFGHSVIVDGQYMVIGAPYDSISSRSRSNSGAVYIYKKAGNNWSLQQKLAGLTHSDGLLRLLSGSFRQYFSCWGLWG